MAAVTGSERRKILMRGGEVKGIKIGGQYGVF
ncbi:MAG: hypothetical protein A4E65_02357 [Syntrophorhabdus sp. PtaU1.Bin153]|nr:MAG: hypothetical protein A4E65_02357 [Syntrophorhabdus sp. PtaU1.Bin153]